MQQASGDNGSNEFRTEPTTGLLTLSTSHVKNENKTQWRMNPTRCSQPQAITEATTGLEKRKLNNHLMPRTTTGLFLITSTSKTRTQWRINPTRCSQPQAITEATTGPQKKNLITLIIPFVILQRRQMTPTKSKMLKFLPTAFTATPPARCLSPKRINCRKTRPKWKWHKSPFDIRVFCMAFWRPISVPILLFLQCARSLSLFFFPIP